MYRILFSIGDEKASNIGNYGYKQDAIRAFMRNIIMRMNDERSCILELQEATTDKNGVNQFSTIKVYLQ